MLTCSQRSRYEPCMAVMACYDCDRIDGRIINHRLRVGGGLSKARFFTMHDAVDATRGRNRVHLCASCLERWNQHSRGIITCAHETDNRLTWVDNSAAIEFHDRNMASGWLTLVQQQNSKSGLICSQKVVRLGSVFEVKTMGDQWLNIELTGGHHVKHRLEVALLCPTYKPYGVILPFLLVFRVITTGSVGARHLKTQLLLIKVGAVKLQTRHANQDYATALAAHTCGLHDRITCLGRGGDYHSINTCSTAESHARRNRILPPAGVTCLGTKLTSQLKLGLIKINRQRSEEHTSELQSRPHLVCRL